jgi:hypothetical protein
MEDMNSPETKQLAVGADRLGRMGRLLSFVALGSLAALAIFRPG